MSIIKKFTILSVAILMSLTGCLPASGAGPNNTSAKSAPLPKELTSLPIPGTSLTTPSPTATNAAPAQTPTQPGEVILLAAGDIADCDNEGDEETAELLAQYPQATIASLGDTVYESGTTTEFAQCYDPTWGQFKNRTRPAVGNHEYKTTGADPYFEYFGQTAGEPDKGYYSYDLGEWHIIVLNSNCSKAGGCKAGNPQVRWLIQDLRDHPSSCALAYWHHPRYSSGQWGNTEQMDVIWQILYENGVEIVLSGHDHNYERFQPIGLNGASDPEFGIIQFVVGTGGKNLGEILSNRPLPGSEVTDVDTYGVLKLSLRPESYRWDFLPVEGATFTDSGEGICHPPPA
jgi:acid phosphatase type 7